MTASAYRSTRCGVSEAHETTPPSLISRIRRSTSSSLSGSRYSSCMRPSPSRRAGWRSPRRWAPDPRSGSTGPRGSDTRGRRAARSGRRSPATRPRPSPPPSSAGRTCRRRSARRCRRRPGSRVRRDGTIATSSNPYARRAIFPLPISISMLASTRSPGPRLPAIDPDMQRRPPAPGGRRHSMGGRYHGPAAGPGCASGRWSRLELDDHVHLTVTPVARPWPRAPPGPPQFSLTTCPVSWTRRSVSPECSRSPSTSTESSSRYPSSWSVVSARCSDSLRRLDHRVEHELGVLGDLVRVVDAGEPLDLAGERLLVQALGIAVLRELVERGVDVDLDELSDHRSHLVSGLLVGRDRAADRRDAVARQELGDEPDPQDVRVTVLLGEPEALGQVLPDHVAVEDLGLHLPRLELVVQHLGDRGLAGTGQAGEPDGEALRFWVMGHRKLLPTAPSGASMPYSDRMDGPTSTRLRPVTSPVACPGRPAIAHTPSRSWFAPSGPGVVLVGVDAPVPHRADRTPREVPEVHDEIRRDATDLRVDVLRLQHLRAEGRPVGPGRGLELGDQLVPHLLVAGGLDDALGLAALHVQEQSPVVAAVAPGEGLAPIDRDVLDRHDVRRLRSEREVSLPGEPVVEAEPTHHRPGAVIAHHDRDRVLGQDLEQRTDLDVEEPVVVLERASRTCSPAHTAGGSGPSAARTRDGGRSGAISHSMKKSQGFSAASSPPHPEPTLGHLEDLVEHDVVAGATEVRDVEDVVVVLPQLAHDLGLELGRERPRLGRRRREEAAHPPAGESPRGRVRRRNADQQRTQAPGTERVPDRGLLDRVGGGDREPVVARVLAVAEPVDAELTRASCPSWRRPRPGR